MRLISRSAAGKVAATTMITAQSIILVAETQRLVYIMSGCVILA